MRLNAAARGILVEGGQARGIVYADADGKERTAHADGDIVISAGALESPNS